MDQVLKIIFQDDEGGNKVTWNLKLPKDGITFSEVVDVARMFTDNELVVSSDGTILTDIDDSYIYETNKIVIIPAA